MARNEDKIIIGTVKSLKEKQTQTIEGVEVENKS